MPQIVRYLGDHQAATIGLDLLLGRQTPGAKAATDDLLVPQHGGLKERLPAIREPASKFQPSSRAALPCKNIAGVDVTVSRTDNWA